MAIPTGAQSDFISTKSMMWRISSSEEKVRKGRPLRKLEQ